MICNGGIQAQGTVLEADTVTELEEALQGDGRHPIPQRLLRQKWICCAGRGSAEQRSPTAALGKSSQGMSFLPFSASVVPELAFPSVFIIIQHKQAFEHH